ncbi:MAG: sigma-70 family RNA polymerase sigma factor [Candidatus Aminicenantes bacterium]|jgi:RNA polymerase sigma factor (sigma-70 family)
MNKEQAKEIFKKYLRHIKRTIKNKINLYEPLDFKTTFKAFLEWLQKEEYKVIREFLGGDSGFENYIDDLIRQFLVEKTFYLFLFEDQDLVENYVRDILIDLSIPPELTEEIANFVREKLETRKKINEIKRNFKERSKLKTYLYSTIANLVRNYQRKYHVKDEYKATKKVEPNDKNDIDILPSNINSPFTTSEVVEIKERVEKLPDIKKAAFKLYYYDGITHLSKLGSALGTSRYKAKKILKSAEDKVLKRKLKNKKNPPSLEDKKREEKNDTPGS